jgi:Loader and inhibitor of phage G40P
MQKSQVVRLVAVLKAAYPRQETPPETVALYAEMLADLDAGDVTAAVKQHVRSSRYFPTIAEIRDAVREANEHAAYSSSVWDELQTVEVTQAVVLQLEAARKKLTKEIA